MGRQIVELKVFNKRHLRDFKTKTVKDWKGREVKWLEERNDSMATKRSSLWMWEDVGGWAKRI